MSYNTARINMIKQQLRTGDVLEQRILDLYDLIPRHEFVPKNYEQFAYSDMQIPLDHNQRMFTPLEEGFILQSLNLQGHEKVLEVGTGSGFFTALLSKLSAQVVSVDYYNDFTQSAAERLKYHQCPNIELITGDASQGWLEKAPYDVIVFTGALEELNETHKLQLMTGGKLLAIEAKTTKMKVILYHFNQANEWAAKFIMETELPLLIEKNKPKVFKF